MAELKEVEKASDRPKFSVCEFAKVSEKLFGYPEECVLAAFKSQGILQATEEEAIQIVNNFMKKEVSF